MILSISLNYFSENYPVRIMNAHWDTSIYYQRGLWAEDGKVPYLERFSEYPQIATFLFGLPFLMNDQLGLARKVTDWSSEKIQPVFNMRSKQDYQYYPVFRYLFCMIMSVFMALTIKEIYFLRKDKRWLGLLLLMPASLYFVHNRFDILPAYLTVLALSSMHQKKTIKAFLILALSVLTKWYALVLLPVFSAYVWQTGERKVLGQAVTVYLGVIFLVHMITIELIGLKAFLSPYVFHLSRGANKESLFYMIYGRSALNFSAHKVSYFLFLTLQGSVACLAPFIGRINTFEKLLQWSALAILFFMLFAKFYSPQWILWIMPLLIMLIKSRSEIKGVVALDIITYCYYPLTFSFLYSNNRALAFFFITLKTLVLLGWASYLLLQVEYKKPKITTFWLSLKQRLF